MRNPSYLSLVDWLRPDGWRKVKNVITDNLEWGLYKGGYLRAKFKIKL